MTRISVLACVLVAVAHAEDDDHGLRRAKQVAAVISGKAQWEAEWLHPGMWEIFSASKVKDSFAELARFGHVTAVSRVHPVANKDLFEFHLARRVVVRVRLRTENSSPHRITYLWRYKPMLALPDLKTAVDLVRKRKGRTALTIYRLGGDEPQVIVDHNGDEELAVASSFKLYVLGTLVQEVASGRRKWDEIVHLDPTLASGGTGNMHGWPANTPVTLHTLATMMIAQSDNTATDHLLRTLGRRTVEEALVPMGCQHASRNIPVLSTLEAWKLKEFQMGRLADKYVSLDVDARRRYLADDVAKVRRTELATTAWRRPNRIDTVGWFASTRDLCAAMIWLRKNTEVGPAASARELLALRPLPGAVGLSFRYQGYKGGSEAGVLNYTFLLETHSGEWYAVSASWNNPHEVLDKSKFSGFVMRILQLLGG